MLAEVPVRDRFALRKVNAIVLDLSKGKSYKPFFPFITKVNLQACCECFRLVTIFDSLFSLDAEHASWFLR